MKKLIFICLIYLLIKSFFTSDGWMRVYDVGQGDAIVFSVPDEGYIVIDGGGNIEIDRYLSKDIVGNRCELSLLLLTHPHYDHLRGLTRLLDHCSVDSVVHYPVDYESREYLKWFDQIDSLNIKNQDTLTFGKTKLYILGPVTYSSSNVNNASVVTLFQYNDFDALLLGDAEVEELSALDFNYIRDLVKGNLEVLKVAHHGAKNAYLESWPQNLFPDQCLISVGEGNKFGHPHSEALEFYKKMGCVVRRTDIEGTIEILLE